MVFQSLLSGARGRPLAEATLSARHQQLGQVRMLAGPLEGALPSLLLEDLEILSASQYDQLPVQ